MSVETDVCRAYLDVMEVVGNRIEADLLTAVRQGSIELDEHNLKQAISVIKVTLGEVTDNGVTGIAGAVRNATPAETKKTRRKK